MRVVLEKVTKTYGPVRALVNANVQFEPSKVTIVFGPNGSGKSTLLSLAATLARPTLGRVTHNGNTPTRDARAHLGWLGHESLCYGDLTGIENLRFAAELHDTNPDAVERMRERFELGPYVSRPFRTYSRGQRQRVALARALVHSPSLLLLDEPTTGLDHSGVELLRNVVRDEAKRGATVVVVTHDLRFAMSVADAWWRLERGHVQGDDPPPS